MNRFIRRFNYFFLAMFLAGHIQLAAADTIGDTETVLNWAERNFPDIFPSHQTTQGFENWLFRYYPETGIYAGVHSQEVAGYVMGGGIW